MVWKINNGIRLSVSSWATTEDDIQRSLRAIATAIDEVKQQTT
ncbi:hypothetical protein [Xenorhabdus lircayensis]|nr:hypothetical protein [Xenorhabdus lircayensis]